MKPKKPPQVAFFSALTSQRLPLKVQCLIQPAALASSRWTTPATAPEGDLSLYVGQRQKGFQVFIDLHDPPRRRVATQVLGQSRRVRPMSEVHCLGSMPKSHLHTPLKSLAFRHRMRLNVLAQHTVHAALPAFASGFEICDNLWAVTYRNQELFFG